MTEWKVNSPSHAVICMQQQGKAMHPTRGQRGNIKNDLLPMAWTQLASCFSSPSILHGAQALHSHACTVCPMSQSHTHCLALPALQGSHACILYIYQQCSSTANIGACRQPQTGCLQSPPAVAVPWNSSTKRQRSQRRCGAAESPGTRLLPRLCMPASCECLCCLATCLASRARRISSFICRPWPGLIQEKSRPSSRFHSLLLPAPPGLDLIQGFSF